MVSMWNTVKSAIESALISVVSLLPESPFQAISNTPVQQYIGYINWLIPVSEIISIMELWLVAISAFYIYQAILRWLKAIE